MQHVLYFLKQIHNFAGKKLYINLFAMTLISLLDGIGIFLLIPMISISGLVNLEFGSFQFEELFYFLKEIPSEFALGLILISYVLIVVIQNILQRFITLQNARIQHGFFRHVRVETYHSLIHANWNYFITNRKSDLINFLTTEIARSSAGTHSFLQFITSLVFTCIQIGIAFWLSSSITTFVLICGLFLIFFNRTFLKKSVALGQSNYTMGREYLAGITDQINGIKDIKSNTLEQSRMDWFRAITKGMQDEQIEYTKLKTLSQMYYKVASAVLIAAFIFIAIKMFQAQAGQLMLIIVIFSRLWPRVAGIQGSMEQIATTLPAFKAVKSFQEECKTAQEFSLSNEIHVNPIKIIEEIQFKEVVFRYHQGETSSPALNKINLVIPANKMTAFVGKSGAGKSTLIDLLMGLNQPETGQVLVDGIAITSEKIPSLRKAISYVPQDPFLFNTTIRENLQLVVEHATEDKMWEALEFSSAAEFVRNLPNGLDTLIGDRGIRLSGGERQRIVLARAILRNPAILVLDEATSALDTENEAKIQKALEELKGRMTIVVIAHRLSTIRNADQVIVLDNGSIIQNGEFGQLAMDKRGMLGHLLHNQVEASL